MVDISGKLKMLAGEFLANRVKIDCKISDLISIDKDWRTSGAFVAVDQEELVKVLDFARELKIPVVVLGRITKYKFRGDYRGLVVINGTKKLKIVGIKGKVGGSGIGVEEASVEVASGESLERLNEFLAHHGLTQLLIVDDAKLTIGERVDWDINLRKVIEKIKIWDQGQVYKCDVFEFNKKRHVLLEAVVKMKAI